MNEILCIRQVAKLCAVVPSTVQFWERKGYLSSFKTAGGHRRFKKQDVLEFLAKRGRKLSHKIAEEILLANTRMEKRSEARIDVNYSVDIELIDGAPNSKLVLNGRLIDISKNGFGLLLFGLDFKKSTIKNILDKYNNVRAWAKEQVGYLRNPLEGTILNFNINHENIRLGVIFRENTKMINAEDN